MFKYLIFVCLALSCRGTVIKVPQFDQLIFVEVENRNLDHYWTLEFLEYLKLIDVEKVLGVAVQYINDAEVMNFLGFIFGPDFKEIIMEFESLEEFNEAYLYLADKGYDTKRVIDFINAALELPPYTKPKSYGTELQKKGMSGFIVDMLGALPLEDIRDRFERKLTTDPEYVKLIATLDSKEFMAILRKMANNPKIEDFKTIFAKYGLDFKFVCSIMKEILGDLYQGIFFCKNDTPAARMIEFFYNDNLEPLML